MREGSPRSCAAALLACVLFATPCLAQTGVGGLGHLEDASVVPRGMFRLRVITSWSRFSERFTNNGVEPLGAFLTSDSLGVNKVPELAPIQSAVQSASGSPFTLTLGRSRLGATAREEVVPIGFDLGVSNRLTLSVVAPVVRRRVASVFRLDTTGVGANVGPNPQRLGGNETLTNIRVQTEFFNAASQLQSRLQACQANPSGPGCSSIAGRQAEAQQLIQSSQAFAADLATLYGSSTSGGMAFVPMTGSAAQDSIAARVARYNTQYRDLLGTSTNLLQSMPVGAAGPAGPADFEDFFIGEQGHDSLNVQERVGIGDVEVGFKLGVIDRPRSAQQRTGILLAVASTVRLPTGSRQRRSEIFDLRLGEGAVIVDSRAAFDLHAGRLGLLAVGDFATKVRDNDTTGTSTRDSRWTELQIAPRWHLSEPLSFHAAYSLRSADKSGGDQLAGGGVTFSTLTTYRRGRVPPVEMRFTHLEAVHGDPGRPKFFRDQIEVRLYFRLY